MGRGSIKSRMKRGDPILKALVDRLDKLINGHNRLVAIIFGGQNPHEANDATNVVTVAAAVDDIDEVINLEQDLIDQYEAHLADTGAHIGADSTNVVTELGVAKEVYTLLNEIKVDYEANRVNVTTHHGAADSTNTVAAVADADTKAKAITLAMALKVAYEAHRILTAGSVHGAADAVNAITAADLTGTSTWTQIAALADDLRAMYEAHRVYTTSSCHAGADSTNTVTAGAVSTVTTALYAGLNELKGDFNAHIAESGTSHQVIDQSMKITAANATTLATSIALVNALKTAYADHISRADDVSAYPVVPSLDVE